MRLPVHPAVFALIGATACWGISFPLMKALTMHQQGAWPGVTSWSVTAWSLAQRFTIAAVVLGLFVVPRRRVMASALEAPAVIGQKSGWNWPNRREWWQGAELAVATVGGTFLQMDGLTWTKASTSAFLTQGYAILLPLWVAVVRRRMPHPLAWLAVVLVVIGGGILAELDLHDLRLGRGEIETLGGSLMFTVQILVVEGRRFVGNDAWRMSWASFVVSAALLIPAAVLLAPNLEALWTPWLNAPSLLTMLVLALVPTLAGMGLMFAFQRHVGTVAAGVTYCSEPVFASCCALIMPTALGIWFAVPYVNEVLTASLVVGGGMVLAAAVLVQFAPRPSAVG